VNRTTVSNWNTSVSSWTPMPSALPARPVANLRTGDSALLSWATRVSLDRLAPKVRLTKAIVSST
jgi:hypothetical protein